MAGPWFAVHKSGDDWQRLEQVWISNGEQDCRGHIEIKVELTDGEESPVDEILASTNPVENDQ